MISRIKKFQGTVWDHYKASKRSLPWRTTKNPYYILVSEVMLQQTQVERVRDYYQHFLKTFPTPRSLANAPLPKLLKLWKGLGYNRRAINLKKAAMEIAHLKTFPRNYADLLTLPGVGPSTAGAIMNFAFNIPTAFIETNIRTVFLYFFFKNKSDVDDKEILKMIEKTQDMRNPREWYYALYDYGVHIKKTIGNQNTRSKQYKKQSAFKGSNRELRAKILFHLLHHGKSSVQQIKKTVKNEDEAITLNLQTFIKEGAVRKKGSYFEIA